MRYIFLRKAILSAVTLAGAMMLFLSWRHSHAPNPPPSVPLNDEIQYAKNLTRHDLAMMKAFQQPPPHHVVPNEIADQRIMDTNWLWEEENKHGPPHVFTQQELDYRRMAREDFDREYIKKHGHPPSALNYEQFHLSPPTRDYMQVYLSFDDKLVEAFMAKRVYRSCSEYIIYERPDGQKLRWSGNAFFDGFAPNGYCFPPGTMPPAPDKPTH